MAYHICGMPFLSLAPFFEGEPDFLALRLHIACCGACTDLGYVPGLNHVVEGSFHSDFADIRAESQQFFLRYLAEALIEDRSDAVRLGT